LEYLPEERKVGGIKSEDIKKTGRPHGPQTRKTLAMCIILGPDAT